MCGIVGSVGQRPLSNRPSHVRQMRLAVRHRGPDAEGEWVNEKQTAAFGHARLSIIDLSLGGVQPKQSHDARYVIVFNGEIFNYQALREELRLLGHSFSSESDTEVLLTAYAAWGEACLEKLNGMFAFAIWDTHEERLFAARDPMGEKPFVYTELGETLLFASELKALLTHPEIKKDIDWSVFPDVLSLRFVPAPQTGIQGVSKLPAGHTLVWHRGVVQVRRYARRENQTRVMPSLQVMKKDLWKAFSEAAVARLVTSDVPVGAFLSGGVDSSSVVAALSAAGFKPKTYCVALGGENDDTRSARSVAKHFGLSDIHEEIIVPETSLEAFVLRVAETYDEPFTDQSAVPSLIVAEHMKKHSTVVLGGDGADELFGGYDTYQHMRLFRAYAHVPNTLRVAAARAAAIVSPRAAYPLEVMTGDVADMYVKRFSVWKDALPISKRYITEADLFTDTFRARILSQKKKSALYNWVKQYLPEGPLAAALLADQEGRLPDGYLYKVDMASMHSALEVRSPFLDPRVVALANQIPARLHLRQGGKWVWRQVVQDILPQSVLNRPKQGFSMPLDRLFREKFGVFAKEVLFDSAAETKSIFSETTLKRVFRDHEEKVADYSNHLWALLMIELWMKQLKK